MSAKDSKIQKKFPTLDDAVRYAEELAKKEPFVQVIQSVDGTYTPDAKKAFYVENKANFIRAWETVDHVWEDGKLTPQE